MIVQFLAFKVEASGFRMNNEIRGGFRVMQIRQLAKVTYDRSKRF